VAQFHAAAAMEAAYVVCFSLQAAHYIGLNCNVVLCVQHLSDDAIVGNDKVRHSVHNVNSY
jgi:hypothetical protein